MSLEEENCEIQLQNQLKEEITECEEKGESKEIQRNQSFFNIKDRGTLKRGSINLQKSFVEIIKQNDTIPEFLLTLDRVCSKSMSKDIKNDEQQQEQNSTMTVGLKAPSSIGKEVNFIDKQQILELLKESDQEGRRRSYTAEEKSKPKEQILSKMGQEVENQSPPEYYMKISQIIRKLLYESCPEYRIIGFLNYYIQYISPINF